MTWSHYDAVIRCFKCGKEIKEGEEWVFSFEWDAYCHKKCCPAHNMELAPDEECRVCDVMRREATAPRSA